MSSVVFPFVSYHVKTPAALLALLVLAGCATPVPDFPAPAANWESLTGQLQYVNPTRSIIGEFTAARHGSDFRLEFSKGGAMTLLKLARHGDLILAEGPLARGRWQGRAEAAPAYLRGWVAVPAGFDRLRPNSRGAGPKSLTLPGAQAGEKFTFQFNR